MREQEVPRLYLLVRAVGGGSPPSISAKSWWFYKKIQYVIQEKNTTTRFFVFRFRRYDGQEIHQKVVKKATKQRPIWGTLCSGYKFCVPLVLGLHNYAYVAVAWAPEHHRHPTR